MLKNQERVNEAQEKIATQTRILAPSDDPSATAQALLFTEKIEVNDQHLKNIGQLQSRLETEDSVLENIKEGMQRARTLAIQAGNASLTEQDRKGLAEEIESIQASLFSLMNTQGEDGKFIFSGYQDNVQAYSFNQTTDRYEYNGDQGVHNMQIAPGVKVQSSDNGAELFERVEARLNVTSNTLNAVAAPVTGGGVYVSEPGEFENFHDANYDPATPLNNQFNIVLTSPPNQYSIVNAGTAAVMVAPTPVPSDGEIKFGGMKMSVAGGPTGTASFTLDAPSKENVLNTLQDLITGLNATGLSNDDYQEYLSDAIVQLTNSQNQVSLSQAKVGGRLNTAERVEVSNRDININNIESRANLVDLDMAEAITELTKEETALQATQATFGRLAQLSLFDYIR